MAEGWEQGTVCCIFMGFQSHHLIASIDLLDSPLSHICVSHIVSVLYILPAWACLFVSHLPHLLIITKDSVEIVHFYLTNIFSLLLWLETMPGAGNMGVSNPHPHEDLSLSEPPLTRVTEGNFLFWASMTCDKCVCPTMGEKTHSLVFLV